MNMHKYKKANFYIFSLLFFAIVVFLVLYFGQQYNHPKFQLSSDDVSKINVPNTVHVKQHSLALLLAQILLIVVVAKCLGWLFKKIKQPAVIGEMLAGILLGPTFFGHYFPSVSAVLFPLTSIPHLQMLSQIGLVFFMFIIGMEVDFKVLKSQAKDAIIISHASIIFPFGIGLTLALALYDNYAAANIDFISFSLFVAVAMSITAFPVLASILKEKKLHHTPIGNLVLICAAADDITAWILLALVIAIVKATSLIHILIVIAALLLYLYIMLQLVRPFLYRLCNKYNNGEQIPKSIIAIFLLVLITSAFITELIGVHALFGAFLAGIIMPDKLSFRKVFIEKVEDIATIILLPLFFVCTGLRTEIGLLNNAQHWIIAVLIILCAIIGKMLGAALTAKYIGKSWKDSLTIGVLMNTRGLMELVVLNMGYELGVLSKEIFSMLVLMALVTTIMTGPILNIVQYRQNNKRSLKY